MPLKSLRLPALLALAGASSVFSFAPLEVPGLIFAALALLFWAIARAPSPRAAAGRGFAFGLGFFVGNVHWVYISMHTFGGMPGWMAAGCVLLFAAYLALFPALAAWLAQRWPCPSALRWPLLLPTLFILTEWLRGWLFTGFAWANIGTSQVKLLAGWFPLLGVYGVGWLLATVTALTVWRWRWGLAAFVAVTLGGLGWQQVAWTQADKERVSVSLVQGGIPQSERWDMRLFDNTLVRYLSLVSQTRGQLVLLPEAAIPVLFSSMPADYLEALQQQVAPRGAALVSGFITGEEGAYLNSVITLNGTPQRYNKHHLVPFGEFVPLPSIFGWMYDFMAMPMSGFDRGGLVQAPLVLGATRLAANVCYEDIFGDELRHTAAQATLLANVSNMAWFDGSWAAEQHLQMARARALETGRWMIRATNTGATAIVDYQGKIVSQLPPGGPGILEGKVENRSGLTPYLRWGDAPVLVLLGGLVLLLAALGYHQARSRQPVVQ